jgi:L,D-transpeptidase ErfK/SrfK
MKYLLICLTFITLSVCGTADAWYPLSSSESLLPRSESPPLIGQQRTYRTRPGDTLIGLARQAGLGFLALSRANPDIDPWLPPVGKDILLPYAFLLPAGIQPGITINLAELRLYYVWQEPDGLRVRVYPVGIGRSGWDTPEGAYEITEKIVHPVWNPPASIRRENPGLPERFPPGPDNPLGDYWLGLSAPGYGIHGTNRPFGVGRRISHGCVRLYPADIRDLYARVTIGTAVRIIHHPVKIGVKNDRLLMEVHRPDDASNDTLLSDALQQIERMSWKGRINLSAIQNEIALGRGVPAVISAD